MISGFFQLFGAGFFGALVVKVIDHLLKERERQRTEERDAEKFVNKHITPLLKSADDLVGKLRALAEQDFKPLEDLDDLTPLSDLDYASLIFLVGTFWSQIELMRRDGLSIDVAKDERGLTFQEFTNCLDSRRVRLIDRISQRAVGEVFLNDGKPLNFITFVSKYETDVETRRWLDPLFHLFANLKHTHERQTLLQYGIVVHAMVDTLDPDHAVTNNRPSWPNKLSKKSWRDLRFRVFGLYLKEVDYVKYIGPPKRVERP